MMTGWLGVARLVLAAVLLLGTAQMARAEEKPGEESLAESYKKYLEEEGYRPTIDKDGDVSFKHEGGTYFIMIDRKDPLFFRLVFPNFWKIEGEKEAERVLAAIDFANYKTKIAKLHRNTARNNVWASVELIMTGPDDFKAIFKKAIVALRAGVANFASKVKE